MRLTHISNDCLKRNAQNTIENIMVIIGVQQGEVLISIVLKKYLLSFKAHVYGGLR